MSEEAEYEKHAKYKSLCEDLTNVLLAFDRAKEWADLIKCLQRLNKVLLKYPQFPVVPEKMVVAKRLAQCLNPALPSGVHLKALDTYELIFVRIGPTRLPRDLCLYSTGLFPLYQCALTPVKPSLLHIFEKYYLPLGRALHPCLKGLLIALLPGIEEEGLEFYERVLDLLDSIRRASDPRLFFRVMWQTLLTHSHTRLAAVNYLNLRLPSELKGSEVEEYVPERSTLVLHALVQALEDSNVLVQRALLDILLSRFELGSSVFPPEAWDTLVGGSLYVFLRRDWSLTRRLHTWLLGGRDEAPETFFQSVTRPILTRSLKTLLSRSPARSSAILPFKILLCLMEKPELGQDVLPDLLVEVFQFVRLYGVGHPFSAEVRKAALSVLDNLSVNQIWEKLIEELRRCVHTPEKAIQMMTLVLFCLDFMPMHAPETQATHIPNLLDAAFRLFGTIQREDESKVPHLHSVLEFCHTILSGIVVSPNTTPDSNQLGILSAQVATRLHEQFVTLYSQLFFRQIDPILNLPPSAVRESEALIKILDLASQCFVMLLRNTAPVPPTSMSIGTYDKHIERTWSQRKILDLTYSRPSMQLLQDVMDDSGPSKVLPWFDALMRGCDSEHTNASFVCMRTFIDVLGLRHAGMPAQLQRPIACVRKVADNLWGLLSPSFSPMVHYEATKLLLALHHVAPTECAQVLADTLLHTSTSTRVDAFKKFALLWRLAGEVGDTERSFTNGLFLMLDALHDDQPSVRLIGRMWIAEALHQVERILDPLLHVLLDPTTACHDTDITYLRVYDTRRVLYVLGKLIAILEAVDHDTFFHHIGARPISFDVIALYKNQWVSDSSSSTPKRVPTAVHDYLGLLAAIALRFIQGKMPSSASSEDVLQNASVQASSAEFLQTLVCGSTAATAGPKRQIASAIAEPILYKLTQAVQAGETTIQVHLLLLIRSLLRTELPSASPGKAPPASSTGSAIASQEAFASTLLEGLKHPESASVRSYWVDFATSSLPFLQNELPNVVEAVVQCFCDLLAHAPPIYYELSSPYLFVPLKGIRDVVTYVLLGDVSEEEGGFLRSDNVAVQEKTSLSSTPFGMLSAFVKDVFTGDEEPQEPTGPLHDARCALFNILPLVVRTVMKVWEPAREGGGERGHASSHLSLEIVHNKSVVREHVLRLLQSLILYYPTEAVAAIIVLWEKLPAEEHSVRSRKVLTDLLNSISGATPELLVPCVGEILRRIWLPSGGGPHAHDSSFPPLDRTSSALRGISRVVLYHPRHRLNDIFVIHFVDHYLDQCSHVERLVQTWRPLYVLLRNVLAKSRNSSSLLLLLRILDHYVRHVPHFEDAKSRHELREITEHIIHTTFEHVGKSLTVASGTEFSLGSLAYDAAATNQDVDPIESYLIRDDTRETRASRTSFSSQALSLMSGLLAPLLDNVWDEKDRVIGILQSTIPHIAAVFRTHSLERMPSIYAAARLLSSFCDYPYTIVAWKRQVHETFLEPDFFLVDRPTLGKLRRVIDVVMSQDRTTLPETINRPSSQLLVTRDADLLHRARLLKRLAFTLFCGNENQYLFCLSTILEKLVEALKLPNAPQVYTQVLLCMRILILRVSPQHLTSFWPLVLTEMIRVFQDPTDLPLLLATFKFLDLVLVVLPSEFLIYEWMFVPRPSETSPTTSTRSFQPLMGRLITTKDEASENVVNVVSAGRPILSLRFLVDLDQLRPYARILSATCEQARQRPPTKPDWPYIEKLVESDFVEFELSDASWEKVEVPRKVANAPSTATHKEEKITTPTDAQENNAFL